MSLGWLFCQSFCSHWEKKDGDVKFRCTHFHRLMYAQHLRRGHIGSPNPHSPTNTHSLHTHVRGRERERKTGYKIKSFTGEGEEEQEKKKHLPSKSSNFGVIHEEICCVHHHPEFLVDMQETVLHQNSYKETISSPHLTTWETAYPQFCFRAFFRSRMITKI